MADEDAQLREAITRRARRSREHGEAQAPDVEARGLRHHPLYSDQSLDPPLAFGTIDTMTTGSEP